MNVPQPSPPRPHYDQLASLFVYPDAEYARRGAQAAAALSERFPEAAMELDAFAGFLPHTEGERLDDEALHELQEIYTRSFEVQAMTTLDVGYVCFGDDYKRAEVLLNLNRELELVGVDCGTELSDHLPNVLRLLARWRDDELAAELVQQVVAPAVWQMVVEFDPMRVAQRSALYRKHHRTLIDLSAQKSGMFAHALTAVALVLEADFGKVESDLPRHATDFLRSIRREMEIEERGAGHRPSAQLGAGLPGREPTDSRRIGS